MLIRHPEFFHVDIKYAVFFVMLNTTITSPEELPEDEGLHVLCEEVEELPVAHLAPPPDLVQVHVLQRDTHMTSARSTGCPEVKNNFDTPLFSGMP